MIKVINIATGAIVAQYEPRSHIPFERIYPTLKEENAPNPQNLPEPTNAQVDYTRRRDSAIEQHNKRLEEINDHNSRIDTLVHNLLCTLPGDRNGPQYMLINTGDMDMLGNVTVEQG